MTTTPPGPMSTPPGLPEGARAMSRSPPVCLKDAEGHVPAQFQVFFRFLPLILFIPLPFLVLRQVGNVASGPAIVLTLMAAHLAQGSVDGWVIVLLGAAIAALPFAMRGLIPALSHALALAAWPSLAIAASQSSATIGNSGLEWVLEIGVWVVLLGVLIFVPLRWRATS